MSSTSEASEWDVVRHLVDIHQAALEDEFGPFRIENSPEQGRVLLIPESATSRDDWSVCYRSDTSPDARLLVDDYAPEVADG